MPADWRGFLLAAAACATLIVAAEMGLGWFRPTPPLPDFGKVGWNAKSSLYRLGTGADPEYVRKPGPQINQLDMRGRPFTLGGDKVRVLLVGDSQVEAAALPFDHLPEVLLEEALRKQFDDPRVEVRSIGVGGWGQAQ